MNDIIIAPKNAVTPDVRKQIEKKGYILIETDEPEKVKMLAASNFTDTNDLLLSALEAMEASSTAQSRFASVLFKRLQHKRP